MFTRTKMICTMGPAVSSYETLVDLIHAGMNVARLNFSHGTHEEHAHTIALLKRARKETGKPLALMLDMQGPKVRVEQLQGGSLSLTSGQIICLVPGGNGTAEEIPFHPIEIIDGLTPGMKVLFDDGYITSQVIEVSPKRVKLEVLNEGVLKNGKGINIPGVSLPLPALTEEDVADLEFGCAQDVDFIAASFIRSAHHVRKIQKALAKAGSPEIPIFAKIESTEGVENFDRIVHVADGILIARGDLGVEVDLAIVPRLQKMMIRKCSEASKPVITATHMMESMIVYPRPTRAEVSDVANAVYDYSSLIMLSAETAIGKYPIETVKLMKRIAFESETDINYSHFFHHHSPHLTQDPSSSLSLAAVKAAYESGAKAIFSFTASDATSRLVAKWRPAMPVIAMARNEKEYNRLGSCWGVIPILLPEEEVTSAMQFALSHGYISFGDVIVIMRGDGSIAIQYVGNVLVKGAKGYGPKVQGKIHLLPSLEGEPLHDLKEKVIVISHCDHTFLPLFQEAKGIILESWNRDKASEQYALVLAKQWNKSLILRAAGALSILKEGDDVILDPGRGLVYTQTT